MFDRLHEGRRTSTPADEYDQRNRPYRYIFIDLYSHSHLFALVSLRTLLLCAGGAHQVMT